jgi:hypothetical protein
MVSLTRTIKGNFKVGMTFALPLISIANARDAKSQVTDKLLNFLKERVLLPREFILALSFEKFL